ncbi:MAG TPA: heavy metal translocating P-type ATPase, partial [Candidatus Limnocylindria bacterium]
MNHAEHEHHAAHPVDPEPVAHDTHEAHAAHDAHNGHDPHADGHGAHAGGHGAHAGHDPDAFRRQFWIVLALTIPVVIWSAEVQEWLGYAAPSFPGSALIPPLLGSVIFVYGGWVFIQGARAELAQRLPGMMTLIALAIVVAFIASWAATLGIFAVDVWWELSTL